MRLWGQADQWETLFSNHWPVAAIWSELSIHVGNSSTRLPRVLRLSQSQFISSCNKDCPDYVALNKYKGLINLRPRCLGQTWVLCRHATILLAQFTWACCHVHPVAEAAVGHASTGSTSPRYPMESEHSPPWSPASSAPTLKSLTTDRRSPASPYCAALERLGPAPHMSGTVAGKATFETKQRRLNLSREYLCFFLTNGEYLCVALLRKI
jgi:hypothetical protein